MKATPPLKTSPWFFIPGVPAMRCIYTQLIAIVYPQLCSMASHCMRRGSDGNQTLNATSLVHEAYLKLLGSELPWVDRVHFFALSARVMRQILVDHSRSSHRQQRGGLAAKISIEDAAVISPAPALRYNTALRDNLPAATRPSPERWRQIEALFHEAADRQPDSRFEFLNRACGTDSELRREVESLLANLDKPGPHLEFAVHDAAQAYLEEKKTPSITEGCDLDPYRVIRLLGAGGWVRFIWRKISG